jgi:hypothetical protein
MGTILTIARIPAIIIPAVTRYLFNWTCRLSRLLIVRHRASVTWNDELSGQMKPNGSDS